jgi:hypothetical protein
MAYCILNVNTCIYCVLFVWLLYASLYFIILGTYFIVLGMYYCMFIVYLLFETMLCPCHVISQSVYYWTSLLSVPSTTFATSTMWVPPTCIKPIPPPFMGTYKRSISTLRWCCPWMVNISLAFCPFFISSLNQLLLRKCILVLLLSVIQFLAFYFSVLRFVFKISLHLLAYSFFKFTFFSFSSYVIHLFLLYAWKVLRDPWFQLLNLILHCTSHILFLTNFENFQINFGTFL